MRPISSRTLAARQYNGTRSRVSWRYGMVALFFKEGRITGYGDMEYKRTRR